LLISKEYLVILILSGLKIQMKKTYRSNRLLWITSTIIILAIVVSAFLLLTQNKNLTSKKSKASSQTYSTKPAPAADNKQSQAVKTGLSTAPGSPTQSTQNNTSTSSTNQPTFSVQIVSSVVSNNNLHIGTLVSGTTVGACTLTASQQNQPTITLGTSNVRLDVNNYDCGVFNINTSKFSDKGVWKITLSVNYNGQTATNSVNVTI